MESPFARITIIGIGLIGGSIAAAIEDAFPGCEVRGIDVSESTVRLGVEQHIVDDAALPGDKRATAWTSGDGSDLIILAIPVTAARTWMERLRDGGYQGVVTDVASTKHAICELADELLLDHSRFIPGHPMAGSETSGIESASSTLFKGAYWILCPDPSTDPDAYQALHELVVGIGARVLSLDRASHDEAVAIISHVPHMVASSLVTLAGRHAAKQNNLLRLAAGGFKDSTRIAAGSPKLWCGIAFDNRDAVADGIDELRDILGDFEQAIRDGDEQRLTDLLSYSSDIRRGLPSKWVPDSANLIECRVPMVDHPGAVAEIVTIASKAACNIQSIEIDHINEDSAMLDLILTDEGDYGRLGGELIKAGYAVTFKPLGPKE